MIRLEKEVTINKKQTPDDKKISPKAVNQFAQKILQKMQKEQIPPTPYNFQIYFDSMLELSDEKFRNDVERLRETEIDLSDEERHLQIEKDIKTGFENVKSMVHSITSIYKNVTMIKNFVRKRGQELTATQSQLSITNIMSSFEGDLEKFDSIMSQQITSLKGGYEKTVDSMRSLEKKAIYDNRYSIYNKKYLIESINAECNSIANHHHSSTIMALKIKSTVLDGIKSNRDKLSITKNIAKLIQKTSKRSDTVGHFEKGIFMMLMRHTDIESAKLACQRVASLIYSSNFFVGEDDIRMDLEIAIAPLSKDKTAEETLALLLNTLPKSSRDGQKYVVGKYKA